MTRSDASSARSTEGEDIGQAEQQRRVETAAAGERVCGGIENGRLLCRFTAEQKEQQRDEPATFAQYPLQQPTRTRQVALRMSRSYIDLPLAAAATAAAAARCSRARC